MYLKPGVSARGIGNEILEAILVAHQAYIESGEQFTITALMDGVHMATSLHYKGQAADLRTRDLINTTPYKMAELIRARLSHDYDVVVERDHIHVEYDPKTGVVA
jgi:hypothetical protein